MAMVVSGEFDLTRDTPYSTPIGKLWSGYFKYSEEN